MVKHHCNMFFATSLAFSVLFGAGADYVSFQDFVTRYQAAGVLVTRTESSGDINTL